MGGQNEPCWQASSVTGGVLPAKRFFHMPQGVIAFCDDPHPPTGNASPGTGTFYLCLEERHVLLCENG
jgi:hypothetical protein